MELTKETILTAALECLDCCVWEAGKDEDTAKYAYYMEGVRTLAESLCDIIDGESMCDIIDGKS